MLKNATFTRTDEQRFIITEDAPKSQYYILAAVHEDELIVSIGDVARCYGLKETTKMAERCACRRVKLQSRGKGAWKVSMWYFGLSDAMEFIRARLMLGDDFYDWFITRLIPELNGKDLSFAAVKADVPPVPPLLPPPAIKRIGDDLDGLAARIDRMIVELVTMKQELSRML